MDLATRAFAVLRGPKRLWIGNHGHAPSTFPAVDTPAMLREGKQWFDRFLRGTRNGIDGPRRVVLAASDSARVSRGTALPSTKATRFALDLVPPKTIARGGKVTWTTAPLARPLEVLGAPVVRVDVQSVAGWSRLVAVLSARTPGGKEIVVSGGGVPLRNGRRTVAIRLIDQATFVPRGSRLTVTLAGSSLAQSPANLLYLDLPMPAGARATIRSAVATIPALPSPVSR
jgi:predicted acyl esterase